MTEFAGTGLTIQKGDGEPFEFVMQAPPVVRIELVASKRWFDAVDPRTRQQTAENIVDGYQSIIQQIVNGQRQNWRLSNVPLWRKLFKLPGCDVEYTNRAGYETIVLVVYPENRPVSSKTRTITIPIPARIMCRVGYNGTLDPDTGKTTYGSFATFSNLMAAGDGADVTKGQFYTGLPLKYKGSAEKTSRFYFEFQCNRLSRPTGVPDKVEPLGGTDDGTFSDSPTSHNTLAENRTKYPDTLNTHRTPVFGLSRLVKDGIGKPDFYPNSTTIGLKVYDDDGTYTGDIPEGPRDPYLMPQSSLLGDITIRGKVHYDFALVASDGAIFYIPQDGSASTTWTVGIRYRFGTKVWVYRGFNNNLSPATSPPPGDGWEDLGGSGGYPPPDYIYEPIVVDPGGDLSVYVDGPGGVYERDGSGAVNVYENLSASPPYWYVRRIRDYYNRLYTHDAYTTSYHDLLLDYATLGTVEDYGVWTADVTTYPETIYHDQWFGDVSNAPDWSSGTTSFQAVHAGRWTEVYKGCWDNLLTSEPAHDGAPTDDDGFKTDGVWSGVEMPDLHDGDVIMCAVDMDVPAVWFGRNGAWPTDPVPGGEGNISLSDYGGDPKDLVLTPVVAFYASPGWVFGDFPMSVDVISSGTKYDPPPGFAVFAATTEVSIEFPE